MRRYGTLVVILFIAVNVFAQAERQKFKPIVSVGTRNVISFLSSQGGVGKGIGGHLRIQLSKRINTEWFMDYVTSKNEPTAMNEYHIGWSLMYYLKKENDYTRLLKPYIMAGHCFDNIHVFEIDNKTNRQSLVNMATTAGMGTHINITPRFDCSITGQYMLDFGREIVKQTNEGKLNLVKSDHTTVDGHPLIAISFNYKISKM